MGTHVGAVNGGTSIVNLTREMMSETTTELPLTSEEEDAIILVVLIVCIIVAIILLFSMGIFIDCKHQKQDSMKKKRLKVKIPPLDRLRRSQKDDVKSLESDMCPNGTSDT